MVHTILLRDRLRSVGFTGILTAYFRNDSAGFGVIPLLLGWI